MAEKILIPLFGEDVAPRFDLATEVLIITGNQPEQASDEKIIVLPQASAEQLCHLILTEAIKTVICGGIEEEYYRYLVWKKVQVLDSIIGPWQKALARFQQKNLQPGDIVYHFEEPTDET
ncbi:hypothetical protein KKI24_15610 [bacterium]|nr:hypothetical protein [bacterium]